MIKIDEIIKLREHQLSSDAAKHVMDVAKAVSDNTDKPRGIRGLTTQRTNIHHINPFLLKIAPGLNCRNFEEQENLDHIESLALSIAEEGVLNPLTIYIDKETEAPTVNNGECRLLATIYAIEVLGATIETVPTQMEPLGTNEVDRLASQIAHNSGKPYSSLEFATNVKRLLAYGWNNEKIEKKTGISQAKQYWLLDLAGMPEDIKTMVRAKEISPSLARETVKVIKSEAVAVETLKKAVTTAKAANRKKVKPDDIESTRGLSPRSAKSFFIRMVKNLFEFADIGEKDSDGTTNVVFKEQEKVFTEDEFDSIRTILDLDI